MSAAITPKNLTPPIAEKLADAVAIITERRTALAREGYCGAGRIVSAEHDGQLILGGEFDSFRPNAWKVLARIPTDTDRLETAPGISAKRVKAGLQLTTKATKARPKVLADGLANMSGVELADIIERQAPRPIKVDVRATTTRTEMM